MAVDGFASLAHHDQQCTKRSKCVVGCMSGTSIDGLDTAMLLVSDDSAGDGEGLELEIIGIHSQDFDPSLKGRLHAYANEEKALTAGDLCQLQLDFANFHIEVITELLELCGKTPDLIAVHGQTVYHKPPLSMQMFTPAPLAQSFHCEVICDMRAADIAAGGQGAPITPLADYYLFKDPARTVAVINLGGFCNVSYVFRDGRLKGKDICPVNQLLDAIANKFLLCPKGYDEDGHRAMAYCKERGGDLSEYAEPPSGAPELTDYAEYVRAAMEGCDNSHSLGTEDSPAKWLDLVGTAVGQQHGTFIAYHACQQIARRIASEVRADLQKEEAGAGGGAIAVLAGGGARHDLLFQMLQAYFKEGDIEVAKSSEVGAKAGVQDRESISMAILGYLCSIDRPITVPAVTGVEVAPVSGMHVMPPYGHLRGRR